MILAVATGISVDEWRREWLEDPRVVTTAFHALKRRKRNN